MKKIIVLISGSGSNLQAIIDQIKLNNINASIECVISNNEDAYGLIRAKESNINTQVIDHSKAEYIKQQFNGKKIGIFYKFKAELQALKDTFGDQLCTELEEFNKTNKHIALQIVSGREGISLKNADCLVMYNIDFSATSYWQSRDRLTTKDREVNNVYWVFSDYGIEKEVYAAVSKKKDYTLAHFKQNNINNPNTLF